MIYSNTEKGRKSYKEAQKNSDLQFYCVADSVAAKIRAFSIPTSNFVEKQKSRQSLSDFLGSSFRFGQLFM